MTQNNSFVVQKRKKTEVNKDIYELAKSLINLELVQLQGYNKYYFWKKTKKDYIEDLYEQLSRLNPTSVTNITQRVDHYKKINKDVKDKSIVFYTRAAGSTLTLVLITGILLIPGVAQLSGVAAMLSGGAMFSAIGAAIYNGYKAFTSDRKELKVDKISRKNEKNTCKENICSLIKNRHERRNNRGPFINPKPEQSIIDDQRSRGMSFRGQQSQPFQLPPRPQPPPGTPTLASIFRPNGA